MAKRTYKTAKGKVFDMEAMRVANEKTTAAGNMHVNARGDIIKGGKVVQTAKERVAPSYTKVTQTAEASLKKPLTREDTDVSNPPKEEPEPMEAEMTTETIKTRNDGSKYKEVITPDGDIEIKDIDPPKSKKKASKKKTSKTTKRPTV